jgi:hypothetical protein
LVDNPIVSLALHALPRGRCDDAPIEKILSGDTVARTVRIVSNSVKCRPTLEAPFSPTFRWEILK